MKITAFFNNFKSTIADEANGLLSVDAKQEAFPPAATPLMYK
ncbi:hypothetical protein B4096_1075 [Heyndrickxia coagulans]|jgi:hypothetical protein|uniref:Uncharacterized protein n=1 Tax=Heyndrickxia coagulans TaxID=1398 RepID=A0AAN0T9J2_HEYCO|nr:hypothetical protein SB48_HM08orf06182 [Heyndrickxia coagulans]KYC89153.1 hypothetical protein B4096_1075 [Heyndrickxia coagulans]